MIEHEVAYEYLLLSLIELNLELCDSRFHWPAFQGLKKTRLQGVIRITDSVSDLPKA